MAGSGSDAAWVEKPEPNAARSHAHPAVFGDRMDEGARPWHQALAFALSGRRLDALGRQEQPDVADFLTALESTIGRDAIVRHRVQARTRGEAWPHQVPADLMERLGYAQFAAALAQVLAIFADDPPSQAALRVATAQPTTPGDQRLLDEVPPHHGS